MTNSLKQTQVAIATKNPNTQKSAIVEALYGLLGNKSRGFFNAFSFAISNATWSSSAFMRLLRSTSLCQSVFTVKSPHTILVPWSTPSLSGDRKGSYWDPRAGIQEGELSFRADAGARCSWPVRSTAAGPR